MEDREKELLELIIQLEFVTRREMMGRYHNNRFSMNPHRGQGRIMSLLKLQPEISQKELCYLLGMSKQGLAELLSKLELAGYITRTPSTEDGRVMMVKLTEDGKKIADEIDNDDSNSKSILSCLNSEEQITLIGYLKRIIMKAEENMPEGHARRHRRGNNRFNCNHEGKYNDERR